jgi:hypothetical protein
MKIIKEVNPHSIKTHSITFSKAFKYAKLMESGDIFPPVKVAMNESGQLICKNGAHRIAAHKMLNKNIRILIANNNGKRKRSEI